MRRASCKAKAGALTLHCCTLLRIEADRACKAHQSTPKQSGTIIRTQSRQQGNNNGEKKGKPTNTHLTCHILAALIYSLPDSEKQQHEESCTPSWAKTKPIKLEWASIAKTSHAARWVGRKTKTENKQRSQATDMHIAQTSEGMFKHSKQTNQGTIATCMHNNQTTPRWSQQYRILVWVTQEASLVSCGL
jgi:hypothetical protein